MNPEVEPAFDGFATQLRVLCLIALVATAGPLLFVLSEFRPGILPACCLALLSSSLPAHSW